MDSLSTTPLRRPLKERVVQHPSDRPTGRSPRAFKGARFEPLPSRIRTPRDDTPMPRGALTRERDVREAYAAHSSELYGFAVRSLGDAEGAEEAVQETFLRAWRAGYPVDREIGSLRTWLFAILRDVLTDLGRAGTVGGGGEPPDEPLEQSLLAWQVEEAMRRIGEQYRQVLVETYYRGRPCAEVATELGVPEGTVRSRVYDGLRALKVALKELELEGLERGTIPPQPARR